jgi:hypothetical protein
MSNIQVRQIDSAAGGTGGGGFNSPVAHTFFESFMQFTNPVQEGSALVLIFCTDQSDTHVTSITDDYGNVWTQVPGARATTQAPPAAGAGAAARAGVHFAQRLLLMNVTCL